MRSSAILFEPFALGGLTLRNRVVMAPMTREMAPGGIPTAAVRDYYARRAEGGVGLIVTEGVAFDAAGAFGDAVPRLGDDDARAGWRGIVDAVHEAGAAIMPQLWHVGAFDPSLIGMRDSATVTRLSPSGLAAPAKPLGLAMTRADLGAAIASYAAAARAARDLGFDGVEIHGAHGYLPDQFFWSWTNHRTDAYGGDMTGRTRFAADVIRACRRAVGADFPIVLRVSQWKQLDFDARLVETPDELAEFVEPLVAAGLDAFHCSTRRYWEAAFPGSPRSFASWTRRLSGLPVIAVGSVTLDSEFKSDLGKVRAEVVTEDIDRVAAGIEAGDFDLIALGRTLLANPDWVHKVAAGRASELRAFTRAFLEELA